MSQIAMGRLIFKLWAEAGGLMSYGVEFPGCIAGPADYVARIFEVSTAAKSITLLGGAAARGRYGARTAG